MSTTDLCEKIERRASAVGRIRDKARDQRFAISQQSKLDRSLEAFVRVNYCKFSSFDDEKTRKKASKEAQALIKAVRKGKSADEGLIQLVTINDNARKPFDKIRKEAEKHMVELVEDFPGADFARSTKGAGLLGLAQIVGECGDLSNYSAPGKLWKRLGLAPYDGHAGSTWRREKLAPRQLSKQEWIDHPFSPRRCAMVITVANSLWFKQWIGKSKTEDGQGRPDGFFGEIYALRRAHTAAAHPDWTPGHIQRDAIRIVAKEYVKHLWVAWLNDDGVAVTIDPRQDMQDMLIAAE